jgi:CBS domain-containing protein
MSQSEVPRRSTQQQPTKQKEKQQPTKQKEKQQEQELQEQRPSGGEEAPPLPQPQQRQKQFVERGGGEIIPAGWRNFISPYKVIDVLTTEFQSPFHPQNIVFVFNTSTVLETLKTLDDNNILSLPVYDPKTNNFTGMIDILDLLAYVTNKMNTITLQQPELQMRVTEELLSQRVEVLMGISERNYWITTREDAPLYTLFDTLSHRDLHRILITDFDQKRVKGIATQSNLVRWLRANWEKLELDLSSSTTGPRPEQPTGGERTTGAPTTSMASGCKWELPRVESFANMTNLIVFPKTAKLFEAFRNMYENKISAVPVVDPNLGNQLWNTGTLSASDLRGMVVDPKNIISMMNMSIEEYLNKIQSAKKKPKLLEREKPKQWRCKPQDTMFDVVNKLTQSGVHRLWVVDLEDRPIGVVSLCDVISVFAKL